MNDHTDIAPDDDEGRPPVDPTEGVRIIGPEEAAEAIERGDVAARRGGRVPRFGDRPQPPPAGPRPALRFPLDASADPTRIERPPVQPAPEPVTGPVDLPHWTEPPTGELPTVASDEDDPATERDADDIDAWSSFATSAPRWRDAEDDARRHPQATAERAPDPERGAVAVEDSPATSSLDSMISFPDDDALPPEHHEAGATPLESPREDSAGPGVRTLTSRWRGSRLSALWRGGIAADQGQAESPSAPEEADHEVEVSASGLGGAEADDAWPSVGNEGALLATGEDENWSASGEAARSHDREAHEDDTLDTPYPGDERRQDDDAVSGPAPEPVPQGAGAGRRMLRRRIQRDVADREPPGERPARGGERQDLRARWAVGLTLGLVAAVFLWWGAAWTMVLVVAIVFLCAVEYFNALRRAGWQAATLLGLVACVSFPLAVYWRGQVAFPMMFALGLAATLLWYLAGAGGREARAVEGSGSTLLGIGWIGALASFAALLLRTHDGRGLLLIAVLGAVAYDVAGFLVGRSAGQRPLSEASPNKTKEGLAGGMAACLVVTIFVVGVFKIGPYDGLGPALLLGVAMAIAAPAGDLCESLVKRDLGVKDMGAVLPGHGGVLDRFDALLFVLPTVFYVVSAIGHKI